MFESRDGIPENLFTKFVLLGKFSPCVFGPMETNILLSMLCRPDCLKQLFFFFVAEVTIN